MSCSFGLFLDRILLRHLHDIQRNGLVDEVRMRGISGEYFRDHALEVGQHVLAAKRIVRARHDGIASGSIDCDRSPTRIENPDQPRAGVEIVVDFFFNLFEFVVWRDYLDSEIGESFPIFHRPPRCRNSRSGDESDVHRANNIGISSENESGFTAYNGPEMMRLD